MDWFDYSLRIQTILAVAANCLEEERTILRLVFV